MKRTLVVGITRERRFSPGKVEDDAAILAATAERLRSDDTDVEIVDADRALPDDLEPALVFAMCQGEEALAWLDRVARRAPVVNAPAAIRACHRLVMAERLAAARVPQPAWALASEEFPHAVGPGPWLKRGDVHAMEAGDVRRVFDEREWREARREFARRGIARAIVQAHAEGPVYKFYGVRGGFFRAFGLPPDFARAAADVAEAGARALGLEIYGGDGVCLADGRIALIDVNDWPSFSRCREEAAAAIARRVREILKETSSHVPTDERRPPRTQVP
jgi:hypothetical protein